MPGRLLDVFSRNRGGVTRSDSFKSHHSDGSSTGKAKKVSFDKKLKVKRFKPGKKKKKPPPPQPRATAAVAPLPAADGATVVASTPSSAPPAGEYWFSAHQRTASAPMRGKVSPGGEATPPSKMPYNYDLDPGLHPSQQPSQVPRVQRHLVRSIVAQFNEEAKKRGPSRQTSLEEERHSASPILIEATPDNAPNRREPFSYTAGAPPTLGPRSKSDYNILAPGELIYAQVVVNGQKSDGKHKSTVHTRVPRSDAKKSFSKSTGNLLAEDNSTANSYQLRNGKKTDNSYYKFDAVDEELARSGVARAPRGMEPPDGRHHLIRLQDTNGLLKKGAGDYETRNVEKWSENEVGPNSKKFTEHEYVHEVSMSQGGGGGDIKGKAPSPTIYGTPLKLKQATTTRENVRDNKSEEWNYNGNSLLRDLKGRHPPHVEKIKRTPSPERRSRAASKENLAGKPAAQYYFGDRSPRASPLLERVVEANERRNGWKTITSDYHRRRNSDDSGSGVGLLSSKLVKKADAEVNGFAEDDPFDSGNELEERRYRREDTKLHNGGYRFGSNGKLASTSLLTRRNSDDNLAFHNNNGFGDIILPAGHTGGYTSEQRRVFRKEEKKHVTKHETRTSRPSPSPVRDDNSVDRAERRRIRRLRERSASGSQEREPVPMQRTPTPGHRTPTSGHGTPTSGQRRNEEAFWASRVKTPSPVGKPEPRLKTTERKVDIEIAEQRHRHRHQSSHHHHHHHQSHHGGAFGDDAEDRMETSGSEPQLYGGSQDSHMSLGSRLSSAEEEERRNRNEAEEVIAAHVNTPQSLLRQMNKRQISYENSQHRQEARTVESPGRQLWFERHGTDEVDDARRARTYLERPDANSNHYLPATDNGNQRWTSATMSRLETSKNRRNDEHRLATSTVDRRDLRRRNGDDIRIQLNGRDVAGDGDGEGVGRSASFNSRVGSYHSENESQHSAGSTASKKRVNFKKSNGRSKQGFGSRSDLSPMHREALLRSASPARPPSATGSLKSNGSDASHASSRSVILHATAVADIPPARGYRYRSANTSPAPPSIASSGGGGRESRSVQRSFSLLSPWKPRKYKDKYDKKENPKFAGHEFEVGRRRSSYHEEQQAQLTKQQQQKARGQDGGTRSHNSSSERLDSLSPLASESPPATKGKGKKKSNGILRRHSMPKDSRFANFFRRKK